MDGSYHLCKTGAGECTASGQHDITVHLGQWRVWKEGELSASTGATTKRPKPLSPSTLRREKLRLASQLVVEKESRGKDREAKVTQITHLGKRLREFKKDLKEGDEAESKGRKRPPALRERPSQPRAE